MPAPPALIATLLTSIRQRLWLDSASEVLWTDARLTEQLQAGWVELWELCVDAWGTGYFEQESDITITSGDTPATPPAGCWQILELILVDGTGRQKLEIFSRDDEADFPWPQQNTGKPKAWRPAAQGLKFWPVPDKTYTVRVRYVPMPPAFVDTVGGIDSWVAGIPQMTEYLIVGACRRICEIQEMDASVWAGRQSEIVQRLRRLKPGQVVRAPHVARVRKRYLGPALQPWWKGR